jgi:deoxyribonuclease-1-like protein
MLPAHDGAVRRRPLGRGSNNMRVARPILAIVLVLALFGCSRPAARAGTNAGTPGGSAEPARILIGSFNLQVFGLTKAAKKDVLALLAKIIRHYDVIAIQEIRDSSGTAVMELKDAVNADGAHYEYLVGPRLGRTSSKEQYAYFYNTATISSSGGAYTFNEGGVDTFEREPYIAHFSATQGTFAFTLIDIHTKPENAAAEIAFLPAVITEAQTHTAEPNVICLGDFNADGAYYDESGYTATFPSSTYTWLISNSLDTTTANSSNTYDRIVTLNACGADFDGNAGVYRYDTVLELGATTPPQVSDHYPVFAEFRVNADPR